MPARFRDVIRAARALGLRIEPPTSGSHWKLYNAAGVLYVIPAHSQNDEVPDLYLRRLCRTLGVDEAALYGLL